MKIYYDLSLSTFEAWSGAKPTLRRIINEGKCEQLEAMLEELYPEGMSETGLNDLLWFDEETVYEWLGIRSETAIRKDIDEVKCQIDELKESYRDEVEELRADATVKEWNDGTLQRREAELWADRYEDDYTELKQKLDELMLELDVALEVYD